MVSQLLTEMDGIEGLKGVFIIGATSQPEILDPSLLRPGRLELRIELTLPDLEDRKEIFRIHLKDKPHDPEVSFSWLAEKTAGWSGARIAALCRQAALNWFRESMEQGGPEDRPFLLFRRHFEKNFAED